MGREGQTEKDMMETGGENFLFFSNPKNTKSNETTTGFFLGEKLCDAPYNKVLYFWMTDSDLIA